MGTSVATPILKIDPPRPAPLSGAAAFGGDFSAVAKDESSEDPSAEKDESDESQTIDYTGGMGRSSSAIPFAPLTTPVVSPVANRLLDDALNDQSEATLQRYLRK